MRADSFFVGQRFYLCLGFGHKRAIHFAENATKDFMFDIHTLVGYKSINR